jgi:hypothetical protein
VRLDVIAVRHSRGRELQRLRVGIGDGDRDQPERAPALRRRLERGCFTSNCVTGLIASLEPADEEHRR